MMYMRYVGKHIHKVTVLMLKVPLIISMTVFFLILNCLTPPIEDEPILKDKKIGNSIAPCQKQSITLQTFIISNKIEPLLPHVNQTLKLLIYKCNGLISNETSFVVPPIMIAMAVLPS